MFLEIPVASSRLSTRFGYNFLYRGRVETPFPWVRMETMFPCDGCGKEYKARSSRDRHKKFECGRTPQYQCPHCPYRAKQKINLKTHVNIKHSKLSKG
ncbi:hypothetical protein M8J76_000885 [Diaphorina citri]|nr:hypothetical protein M8J75_014227 [Diaphorina citri]KAI5718834.1 hypothetical protein M8J76_000885 [Diaphorina citri]KAI5721714.1 hypothetical protein M8J77_024658 [Diaphorina citri]